MKEPDRHTDAEQRSFEAMVETHKRVITKVCYMYAENPAHFKDLYQETLINLWQARDRFRGESSEATWIYRISINTCISCFRRWHRHSETLSMSNPEMMELADRSVNDHEHAMMLKEMYSLINRLPALDKAIILMWLDEKSYEEISEVTGLKRNAVAARLRRCKLRLQKMSDT